MQIALTSTEQLKEHVDSETYEMLVRKGHEDRQDHHTREANLRAKTALANTKILKRIHNTDRRKQIQNRELEENTRNTV